MNRLNRPLLCTLLFASLSLTPSFGKTTQKAKQAGPKEAFKAIHETVVISVSADSIAVGDGKKQTTYAIIKGMGGTDVYVNNIRRSITDVQAGMVVTVSGDGTHASTIIAHDPPVHNVSKKK